MSSIPREALNTNASKPGLIGVPSSALSALARAITSWGSEMSAGVIWFITSAAVYPRIRCAPPLKIWMTPLASVAMLEKLALLKIALWSAPALSNTSVAEAFVATPFDLGVGRSVLALSLVFIYMAFGVRLWTYWSAGWICARS